MILPNAFSKSKYGNETEPPCFGLIKSANKSIKIKAFHRYRRLLLFKKKIVNFFVLYLCIFYYLCHKPKLCNHFILPPDGVNFLYFKYLVWNIYDTGEQRRRYWKSEFVVKTEFLSRIFDNNSMGLLHTWYHVSENVGKIGFPFIEYKQTD